MLTVLIANMSGSFVVEIPTACTATIAEQYSYPRAGSLLITPVSNDCQPSGAACAPAFGGATTCPTPPPVEFSFTRNSNELTFNRVSVGPPTDSCPAGQAVEYRMSKQ